MAVAFYVHNKVFHVPRARVILIDEQERIFLVRHWAGENKWSIPGGGIERDETAIEAAQRELREELGIVLEINRLVYLTTLQQGYTAPIFIVRIEASELPAQPYNRREITATNWFSGGELPQDMTKIARLALRKLLK